jgi:hypothetical protein
MLVDAAAPQGFLPLRAETHSQRKRGASHRTPSRVHGRDKGEAGKATEQDSVHSRSPQLVCSALALWPPPGTLGDISPRSEYAISTLAFK